MAVSRIHIEEFLQQSSGCLILDVRSPSEYLHAHFPDALSLPLFSDEERKIVGTAYKQESRENAIKIGLEFFGPRMRSIVEQVEAWLGQKSITDRRVFIYCWRGGMRSGAIAWLLDLYGFKTIVLQGGYKAFRRYCLDLLEIPLNLQVIGGFTGSGKTSILKKLQADGQAVIDLEMAASHRGSVYGGFSLPAQPSQEAFENRIALQIQRAVAKKDLIFIEDESQRIGKLTIPHALWKQLLAAPLNFLEIPFAERLDQILLDYAGCSVDELIQATTFIRKRLGGLETKKILAALEAGQIRDAFEMLLNYYDRVYLKGLHNRMELDALVRTISCAKVTDNNALALLNQNL